MAGWVTRAGARRDLRPFERDFPERTRQKRLRDGSFGRHGHQKLRLRNDNSGDHIIVGKGGEPEGMRLI